MNTKMLHDQRQKNNTKMKDIEYGGDGELKRKGCSGALLDMLAEVASQTLHSDPSVKTSPIKRSCMKTAEIDSFVSNKRKRVTCRTRSGEGDSMDLEHLRSLTANHLLKLFSEFDGDEIRRIFTFTCFMQPEQCNQQFSSFGSEGKARQQMRNHLLEHVHQLELKAKSGIHFTVESIKVRRRRLAEKLNGSSRRHKLSTKIKVEPAIKLEPSDENDSSLPNKEYSCTFSENYDLIKPNIKTEKLTNQTIESLIVNDKNVFDTDSTWNVNEIQNESYVAEKLCDTDGKKNNESCNEIYEEHNYVVLNTHCTNNVMPYCDQRRNNGTDLKLKQNWCTVQMHDKQEKIMEGSNIIDKTPTADLGKFMMAETLRDMVMVCVVEDDQLQLKQLPCVGQEIDVNTSNPLSCKMVRSDDLPVVQDNRKVEPQDYSNEVIREVNCEKSIERDEYILKKKPKGKAKFIGQSKAEKEMAIHLIETMKRKENTDSLECHICNPPRSFTAPTTLISHYRSHAGIKPYECRICHSVFTRQHSLNYHMLIHSNQTRFTCGDCGRKFRHPSHFKEHRRRHTGESPYECSDCMLRFKTRNTYKRHLKTRHGKVLTTSGGLIILSEEEFRRVRTLPRSPHNTNVVHVKQDMHIGKKKPRKSKGRCKVGGRRKQSESFHISEEEEEDGKEEMDFHVEKNIYLPTKVTVTVCNKRNVEENEDVTHSKDTRFSNRIESKSQMPINETRPSRKSFQDIVEEAMRQSNISFTDHPESDKANVVVLDVPVANTEDTFSPESGLFERHQESTELSRVSSVNVKNNWNTGNVHLKKSNKTKVWTSKNNSGQNSASRSATKGVTTFEPKACRNSLILPNAIGFNPLVINRGISQAQTLPTLLPSNLHSPSPISSSAQSSPAFLSSKCAMGEKSSVSAQLDSEVLDMVAPDRLSIISADSHQATIMLLTDDCNNFTTIAS